MISIPKVGLACIEREEGLRLSPYRDVAGIWTYGVGNIRDLDGRPVTRDTPPLTEAQAQLLLARDAGKTWQGVCALTVGCRLTENELGALLSFTYNLGINALRTSSLRQSIVAGRAPPEDEWTRWCLAGRPLRRDPGLYGRRLREKALFIS